ncbi:hypothetical protein P4479_11770 [Brevibacillus agri]|uniref:hypothetical protein n=1 Tax=Brevibacillus agri TaxID=51101 RepID=UPI002E1E02C5|nr:hypothetical protein [Brevibacillus agri]
MTSKTTFLNLGNSFILPPRIKATIKDKQITSKSMPLASKDLRKNTTQASGVSSKNLLSDMEVCRSSSNNRYHHQDRCEPFFHLDFPSLRA